MNFIPLVNLCLHNGQPVCTDANGSILLCSILPQPYTPPHVIQAIYSARQLELKEADCFASNTRSGDQLYTSFMNTSSNITKSHLEQRLKCEQNGLNTDTSRLMQAINNRVEQLRSVWISQDQNVTKFDALLALLIRQELKHKGIDSDYTRIASFLDVPFQLSHDMYKQRIRRHSTSASTKCSIKTSSMTENVDNCDVVEADDATLTEGK